MSSKRSINQDYAELRRQVKEAGLLELRPRAYLAGIIGNALAYVLFLGGAISLRHSWWSLCFALPLALTNLQLMLYLHDALHNALFKSKRASAAYCLVVGSFMNGMGSKWWRSAHNAHHAHTWHEERDPDITYPCFALNRAQAQAIEAPFRPILRNQHWLLWPLSVAISFNIKAYTLQWWLSHGFERDEVVAVIAGRICQGLLLFVVFEPAIGLAFWALQAASFGLYSSLLSTSNHWGRPVRSGKNPEPFLESQVVTSRNIKGPWLVRYLYGGLDWQIEHHLFPAMPRQNFKRAAAIVRPFCQARGIDYSSLSPQAALGEVYSALRDVAHSPEAQGGPG